MKKLGLVLLAFIVAVWFGACGDSKDSQAKSSDNLGESQTINIFLQPMMRAMSGLSKILRKFCKNI